MLSERREQLHIWLNIHRAHNTTRSVEKGRAKIHHRCRSLHTTLDQFSVLLFAYWHMLEHSTYMKKLIRAENSIIFFE